MPSFFEIRRTVLVMIFGSVMLVSFATLSQHPEISSGGVALSGDVQTNGVGLHDLAIVWDCLWVV